MYLVLAGTRREFTSLKQFRLERGLPEDFNVNLFEPKVWVGLGSMNSKQASVALLALKESLLAKVPLQLKLAELMPLAEVLAIEFSTQFLRANKYIRLKQVEIEFAVSGFGDVLRAVVFDLVWLWHTHGGNPEAVRAHFNFADIYQHWLDSSAKVSGVTHAYNYQDCLYEVRVVYNVYGRVGLIVQAQGQEYYLSDYILACPAANYMYGLCAEITEKIIAVLLAPT